MTRYLIEVYKVEIPANGKRRDDISEETEDWLKKNRDFQFQLQGDDLREISNKLRSHEND